MAGPRSDRQSGDDYVRRSELSKPLWAIALALWVIAIVGIIGAVKMYQVQVGLQQEIEKIRKWPRL